MTERRDQGAPSPTAQAEDAWWAAVYARDADAPEPDRAGSVDDWFASALGAIGAAESPDQAPEVGEDAPVPDVPTPPALPDVPDLPHAPHVPEGPDLPDVGDAPDIPDVPGQPDLPKDPDLPDVSRDVHDTHGIHGIHDVTDGNDVNDVKEAREEASPSRASDPRVIAPRTEPDSASLTAPALPPRPPSPRSEPDPSRLSAPEPDPFVNPPSRAPGSESGPEPRPESEPQSRSEPRPEPKSQSQPVQQPVPQPVSTPVRLAKKPERATVPTPTLPDGIAARWGRSRPGTAALPEPDSLPEADPDALGGMVPDTALELARHGSMTLRAASARGEQARGLGLPRTDRLLVARFGQGVDGLLAAVVASSPAGSGSSGSSGASGVLGAPGGDAQQAAQVLAAAVGRSRAGLLADLREGAQEQLRYGLQRLTARAARELGPGGAVHALIAPLDPTNRLRAGFGTGPGALLLLGDDAWYDAYAGCRLAVGEAEASTADASPPQPDGFRFRAVVPEPGDVLLLCSEGLAAPLRTEAAVAGLLAEHWSQPHAPGGVDFLRQLQARAQGHTADRTAVAVWED